MWAPNLKSGLRFPKLTFAWLLTLFSLLCVAGCNTAPAAISSPTPNQITPAANQQTMPSPTPTLEATEIAENTYTASSIAILAPGNGSQVVGAIQLRVAAQPGADGQLYIELSDAAGRLLLRQVHPFTGGELALRLPFEVSHPPMPARLTVRTLDAYGRIAAMRSVEMVLLAEGESRIQPGGHETTLHIEQPIHGEAVPNGNLSVVGTAQFYTTQPLSLQLVTREGRILIAREVYLQDNGDGSARFETTLTLSVQEPTWMQVAITAFGRQLPGASHFDGVEVQVLP